MAATTGVVPGRVSAIKAGDQVQLGLAGANTARAVVELAIPGRALALRLPDLDDSVLFIELEPGPEAFHIGWWLSVYDAGKAKDLVTPSRETFRRIRELLSAT